MREKIKKYLLVILAITGSTLLSTGQENSWTDQVGAKSHPAADQTLWVNNFGAVNNGLILSTKAIQWAIDSCAASGGGRVAFQPGIYLTGAIYLKSNVELYIDQDVELKGSIGLDGYPEIDTRVAGIEMEWPSAIINVLNQNNVSISGKGTIHAQGRYHWERYWKLREDYTPKGLRWAADYDCKRVRTILVSESEHVTIENLTLKQAGFWTVHLLYSSNVTVRGIIIQNNIEGYGPSTDGIDIDSSTKILIEDCDIDCNDDNFCLKAGRDADGLRVNRPTEYVVIRNCISRHGGGLISFGSETSGGIRHILVNNLEAFGTTTAIRFKSAMTRGGEISNVEIGNIKMYGVKNPVEVTLNWNPSYSYATINDQTDSIPAHWVKLLEKVEPVELGIPVFRDVYIHNITASEAVTAFNVSGIKESYIENFTWKDVSIGCEKPGKILFTKNWQFNGVNIISSNGELLNMKNNLKMRSKNSNI